MEHTDLDTQRALIEANEHAEAARLIAEGLSENAPVATQYRDVTPTPTTGDAMPVPQPGRPPMSQKAADASGLMLSGSLLTLAAGGAATGILWASGAADPAVVAMVCAAPPALVLAISRVVRRFREAVEAAPTEHHHHYSGPVHQDHRETHTTNTANGLWATARSQQPEQESR